jgi:MFS family permease
MPGFVTIWLGQLVSVVGSHLTEWGLGVWIYQKTGSPTLFAINLLCMMLPNVLIAPLAGVVADRYDRRLILMLVDTGAALATLAVTGLLLTNRLEVWHIYAATTLSAACSAFQWPTYSAATTMLVPREHLGRAGGMAWIGESASQFIAPALAGALYVSSGLWSLLVIDLATFVFAVLMFLFVHIPQPEPKIQSAEDKETFWQELTYGWRYIVERPGLRGLLTYFAIANWCGSVAYPLLTTMLLNMTTPDMVGLVGSISGIGMVAGTAVMTAWGGPKRHALAVIGFDILAGVFIILTGLTPLIPVIVIAQAGLLATVPLSNGNSQAMWQSKVAPEVQGRVFAVRRMIAFSIIPLAYLAAGPLSEVFEPLLLSGGALAQSLGGMFGGGAGRGTGLLITLMGIGYFAVSTIAMLTPRIRRIDVELPDVRGGAV